MNPLYARCVIVRTDEARTFLVDFPPKIGQKITAFDATLRFDQSLTSHGRFTLELPFERNGTLVAQWNPHSFRDRDG